LATNVPMQFDTRINNGEQKDDDLGMIGGAFFYVFRSVHNDNCCLTECSVTVSDDLTFWGQSILAHTFGKYLQAYAYFHSTKFAVERIEFPANFHPTCSAYKCTSNFCSFRK